MEPSRVRRPAISILYVDDEPAFLDIMKISLERSGECSVTTVQNAPDALRTLSERPYDAIISDYQMPEMDGITFLNAVREQFGNIPFILFTGRGREEVVIDAINSGADFYLQKGSDMKAQVAELSTKVRYAVTRRQVEKDLIESEERYRNVVEDQTEFICRFLPDGTHSFVNEAYCRYFGLKREEIIGSLFRPAIPPEDKRGVGRLIASLTREHPYGTIDQRIIMPDGSIRWQRWVDRAIFDQHGTLVEYQSVGRDITELKEAEEALKESEEKYRAVFENTGTAMVVIEENRIISLANSEFTRLSGYSRDEIEGKKCWTEFVVPEDLERMTAQHELRRKHHEKALTHYEFQFVTKSGDIRTIYLSIGMIPGTKKSISSLQDITLWKKTQEDLIGSEERFRQLFTRMPSGVAIYEAVDDGRDFIIRDFNTAAESIEHVRKEDIIGKKVTEVFPGVKEFGIFSVFQRVWKTGTAEFYPDTIYRDAHDAGSWRENWTYRLPTGEIVAIYNDITDRKHGEENLKERERFLSTLISNLPGFAYRCRNDRDWTMEYISEGCRDLTGYAPDDFIGNATLTFNDIILPDYRELLWNHWQEVLEQHQVFELEYPIITRDGKTRWVWERGRGVYSEDNELLFLEGFITDITKRKEAEEAIRKAHRQMHLLTGITRHDILNSIMAAEGYLDLMEGSDGLHQQPFKDKILQTLEKIKRQIKFTKEYETLGSQQPIWQDIDTLIRRCEVPPSLHLHRDRCVAEVYADPMVGKVFENLLDNSLRHGGEHLSIIRVSCEVTDPVFTIRWEDDGVGIPADEKERIFERGYGEGSGLGLFFTREILAITGMTIHEDGVLGKGARFVITVQNGHWRATHCAV
ncbi:MAG: PAS domain S-box protein [Methanolinea sp.]